MRTFIKHFTMAAIAVPVLLASATGSAGAAPVQTPIAIERAQASNLSEHILPVQYYGSRREANMRQRMHRERARARYLAHRRYDQRYSH
jgi:hypothetical protein